MFVFPNLYFIGQYNTEKIKKNVCKLQKKLTYQCIYTLKASHSQDCNYSSKITNVIFKKKISQIICLHSTVYQKYWISNGSVAIKLPTCFYLHSVTQLDSNEDSLLKDYDYMTDLRFVE